MKFKHKTSQIASLLLLLTCSISMISCQHDESNDNTTLHLTSNEIETSATQPHEVLYNLANSSFNATNPNLVVVNIVDEKSNETLIPNEEKTSTPIPLSTTFFHKILGLFGDRYTLIMFTAFCVFLLFIACLVAFVICICKNMNRNKADKFPVSHNPAYDQHDFLSSSYKFEPFVDTTNKVDLNATLKSKRTIYTGTGADEMIELINTPDRIKHIDEKESDDDDEDNKSNRTLTKANERGSKSILNSTGSTTSLKSTSSAKSVLRSPLSINLNSSLITPVSIQQINEQIKRQSKENLTTKTIITATITPSTPSGVGSENTRTRYTPISLSKSRQQLINEKQLTHSNSKRNILSRQTSESNNDRLSNKRISVASSIGSIVNTSNQMQLNFQQVEDDIDDLVVNPLLTHADSATNLSNSRTNNNSVNNSISDIYLKAINEKREALKQQKTSVDISKRRLSAHQSISVDPRGNTNVDAMSIKTMSSEKSCY